MTGTANFDRLAGIYRWMEWATFGPWLDVCRGAFLAEMLTCGRVLVLGDGDGRFSARLLRANRGAAIDAVDASAAMLKALVRRAGPHAFRIRAEQTDLRCWRPSGARTSGADLRTYDLVVTHFLLDCLSTDEVQRLAETLSRVVSPNSLWVVSEFAIPMSWFGRSIARPIVWCLYLAFGWLTGLQIQSLPDHRTALRKAGFALRDSRSWLGGLLASELWFFAGAPSTGATTGTQA